jgi:hypothetical protein
VKIELTYAATTVLLFFGFIQGWPQAWERSDNKSVVSIVAHDAFKYLATATTPTSRYEVEVQADTPAAWYRLDETSELETIAYDSSGNGRHATYYEQPPVAEGMITYAGGSARHFVGIVNDIRVLSPYSLTGTDFSVEFWIRTPAVLANDMPVLWQGVAGGARIELIIGGTGSLNGTGSIEWFLSTGTETYTLRFPANSIRASRTHHVVLTRDNGTFAGYVDGVALTASLSSGGGGWAGTETAFGSFMTIGSHKPDGTTWSTIEFDLDEVAVYASALSAGRVAAHFEAATSASAGEDVDARITRALSDCGISWLSTSLEDSQTTVRGADYQGLPLLTYLLALERTEQGRLFIAADGTLTFYNRHHDNTSAVAAAFTDVAGGSLPYAEAAYEYDDTRIINNAVVSRSNGNVQTFSDATSVTEYGLRSVTVDGLQGQSDEETLGLAQYLVGRYKNPAGRVRSLTVKPRSNVAGLFPVVRDLGVGDKVTFRRLPLGTGSAFTKTLTIEGVSHSIGVDGEWTTTYLTTPVDPNSYLVLDDASLGQLDQEVLSY